MDFGQKIPSWIVVYLSILLAIMLTVLSFLAVRNAFFSGPKFNVGGYELGISNSDKQVYLRWWSVPHVFESKDWPLCYSKIAQALDEFRYIDQHNTEAGWHYAKMGKDYALVYCEGQRARIVIASSDSDRANVRMNRFRADLVGQFRKQNVLDESRVDNDDGTIVRQK